VRIKIYDVARQRSGARVIFLLSRIKMSGGKASRGIKKSHATVVCEQKNEKKMEK
jgi:hypothetical protein